MKCDATGRVDPDDIRQTLRNNTRLVAILHASNVTGVIQPIAEIGRIVRQHGARFLVDAAQTIGHLPISIDELSADFLAAPGHKGLMGPLGTGFLYIRPGLENELRSLRQGGTGTQSQQDRQPESLPDKFESGNHNVPGLVGLAAALEWLEEFSAPSPLAEAGRMRGIASIRDQCERLTARLVDGLKEIRGVTIYSTASHASLGSVSVVSITIEGYDPQEAAILLDANFGVQVCAGLHCAPLMHRALGTLERGGTIRLSIGAFNTAEDIDAAIAAVQEIAAGV